MKMLYLYINLEKNTYMYYVYIWEKSESDRLWIVCNYE